MRTRDEELFHQVVDLSTEARDRHFAEGEIAPETRSEVEALIEFDVKSTTSLETGLGKVTRTAFEQFEAITMHCGSIRIILLICFLVPMVEFMFQWIREIIGYI